MDEETSTFDRIEDLILLVAVIIIILLKLLNIIKISWFWLLSIFWIPAAFLITFLVFAGLIAGILGIYDKIKEKKNERN